MKSAQPPSLLFGVDSVADDDREVEVFESQASVGTAGGAACVVDG